MKTKFIVGSRGSTLALTQTKMIVSQIQDMNPGIEFEIEIIKTQGDLIQDVPLHKMNDKGIFVKEIEQALLEKRIDLAVHSMKDMPTKMDERLCFPVIPKREDPRDVLIIKSGTDFEELKKISGLKIGTGSKRRVYQLDRIFDNAHFDPIRGNIDTRINKLHSQDIDAIMLAASGLIRVGRENEISHYLDQKSFVSAPCQGILALQTRSGDNEILEKIQALEDDISRIQYNAERAFLAGVDGGCHVPVGAYCDVSGNDITIYGVYGDADGNKLIKESISGSKEAAAELGAELARKIIKLLEE